MFNLSIRTNSFEYVTVKDESVDNRIEDHHHTLTAPKDEPVDDDFDHTSAANIGFERVTVKDEPVGDDSGHTSATNSGFECVTVKDEPIDDDVDYTSSANNGFDRVTVEKEPAAANNDPIARETNDLNHFSAAIDDR